MRFPPSAPDPLAPRAGGQLKRHLLQGAILWLAYSVLQVALNGIVLDETVIAAQVIGGSVEYPAGHPHGIYYWRAYSLAHYLSAALWTLVQSPAFISALRNVLFLFVSTFSVYSLALVLTDRALWAHFAAVLVVLEAPLAFSGVYPIFSFPNIYSNGHVGTQVAVLILAFLLAGMWRTSGLLLGLLPAIHGAMIVMVWPFAALYGLLRGVLGDPTARRRVLGSFGVGLAGSVALWVVIALVAPSNEPLPLYTAAVDGETVREQFRLVTDVHRRPLPLEWPAYLAGPVALFALLGLLVHRRGVEGDQAAPKGHHLLGVLLLAALLWAYIFGTSLLDSLGVTLPDAVYSSMPNRFSNLSVAILMAVTATGLAFAVRRAEPLPRALVALALAGGIVGLALLGSPLTEVTRRDMALHVAYAVWGVLFGTEAWSVSSTRHRLLVLVAFVAVGVAGIPVLDETRAPLYSWGIGVATFLALALASRVRAGAGSTRALPRLATTALVGAMVVSAAITLPGRRADRLAPRFVRWDMMSENDRAIDRWLEENARPDEMVLAGFLPRSELQLKTGQPVLFEMKTMWMMNYMPGLAPVIAKMVKDLYGVDYADPQHLRGLCRDGRVSIWCDVWDRHWAARTRTEWEELGRRYGFRLVVNETRVPLDLPVAYAGERWTLYSLE